MLKQKDAEETQVPMNDFDIYYDGNIIPDTYKPLNNPAQQVITQKELAHVL
jgi:hypothetical protein